MKSIAIVGSTGSIGQSALAVVDAHSERLRVVALAAGENVDRLSAQTQRYRPRLVSMGTADARRRLLAQGLPAEVTVAAPGREGLVAVASHPDAELVLFASAGTDSLEAVLAAIACGKTIALANKEILVMAGRIVTEAAQRRGVTILPVDSEHNAIHQCLHGRHAAEVKRLVLTASGGPFRGWSADRLAGVTAADALRHPTWQMGRKITIDSATLMNKGLEVIEAHWLFGVMAHQIDVVIHPQSVVHSMVELVDGSLIAQLGVTDMRLPIQYAFSYPARWTAALPSLDLARAGTLEFAEPDRAAFPCLGLAYRALEGPGSVAVVLNAANEIAVARFLEGRIAFTAIGRLIEDTVNAHTPVEVRSLAEVRTVDAWARDHARELARGVELV
ncbi:MAG: 1-deoxy-D-xylulose-5-phosphate reductoisomerase [Acidimicrobiia bacterium]|nr:1-deoxy-D-xylulose-5-phosphate reductoisomerase [Acidimicrobiia bacterium]